VLDGAFLAGKSAADTPGSARLLVVAIVLVVVVAEERGVLAAAQVLFEAAFAFWVDVAFATEEGEEDGEEDEGVGGSPEDEGDPDPEVVDFEDLAAGEGECRHSQDLRDCDPADDAASDVNHGSPGAGITSPEAMSRRSLHGCTAGEGECSGNVCCELNTDADADDQVDKGDSVQGYTHHGHRSDNGRHCHAHNERYDKSGR